MNAGAHVRSRMCDSKNITFSPVSVFFIEIWAKNHTNSIHAPFLTREFYPHLLPSEKEIQKSFF